jgi:serine/threonine protein phosphatase PrpC
MLIMDNYYEERRYSNDLGEIYAIRCQGSSHVRDDNKPCQDYFKVKANKKLTIMALADGHGSAAYDLSEFGSKLAVEAAINELRKIYTINRKSKYYLFSALKNDFPKNVVREWKARANKDIVKRDSSFDLTNKSSLYKRYGTTLMFSMITKEEIFVGQIGDGNILIIDKNGNIEIPIPTTDDLIANETYSMTSRDAVKLWRIYKKSLTEDSFIMMSSDGVYNSFESDEEFHKFAKSLYKNIEEFGLDKVSSTLPEWVKAASKNGSGDDLTIVFSVINLGIVKK